MTDQIKEQILAVRNSAVCNMFDTNVVQRYAHDHNMYDLVLFIEENKRAYSHFILTGNTEEEGVENGDSTDLKRENS